MQTLRLILPLLAAYGLLVVGGNTALYFLEFGDLEERMAQVTHRALLERLGALPDLDLEVRFDSRDGVVQGVVHTAEGLLAARTAVEELARKEHLEGLPVPFRSLEHDLAQAASFHLFESGDTMYLKSFLPVVALARLEDGLYQARQMLPRVPRGLDDEGPTGPASPQQDAADPEWQDKVGDFVAYFFKQGRTARAEIEAVAQVRLRLAGEVQSEEERDEIIRHAKEYFPSLAERIENAIELAPRVPPFHLQTTEGVVALEGMVPTIEIQEQLFDFVRSQGVPGQSFVNGLQVAEGVPGVSWLERKPTFFKDLFATVKDPAMVIGPEVVLLKGEAPSRKAANDLILKVQSQLSDHEVTDGLSFPELAEDLQND